MTPFRSERTVKCDHYNRRKSNIMHILFISCFVKHYLKKVMQIGWSTRVLKFKITKRQPSVLSVDKCYDKPLCMCVALEFLWCRSYPANTKRNKHIIITSKLRFKRSNVIISCLICCVFAGYLPVICHRHCTCALGSALILRNRSASEANDEITWMPVIKSSAHYPNAATPLWLWCSVWFVYYALEVRMKAK